MELKKLIGKNIKYLCVVNNYDNKDLAKLLGKSPNTVSNYRQGQALPPVDVLLDISKIFKISLDELTTVDLSSNENQPLEKKEVMYQIQELVSRVKDLESKYESVKK